MAKATRKTQKATERKSLGKAKEPVQVKKAVKVIARKSDTLAPAGNQLKALLKKAEKRQFFSKAKPMLATLVGNAFDDEGWLYEIKWDGYRALAFMNKKDIELKSRNDKSFNDKYYPIYTALQNWRINAIVDGEIVVVGENGQANFGGLQNWRSEADGELLYYLFDILWYNGYDLRKLALTDRKAILAELVPENSIILLSQSFETSGTEFLEVAKKMELEGIMAKREDSTYHSGDRTTDWLKIKANKRQEVVIGGYTKNEGSNKPFSSLLVGVFENKKFIYTGKIGTGFNVSQQKEMMELFKPLIIDRPTFIHEPDVNKPSRFRPNPPKATATWLKPKLVCEVSYAEMTSDGVMRHPSFEGLREDKKATEVVFEEEKHTTEVKGNAAGKYIKPRKASGRKTLLNPTEETQVKTVAGHDLKFTNLSKLYWLEDNVTKRDMLNYYYQVAEYILPYLKDRPQTLYRFPNGIHGNSFYQKDVKDKSPGWVKTFPYTTSEVEDKEFLVGDDEASLLWMASLGCIEMNPWFSRIQFPDNPDYCVIDLDPDKNTFEQVITAALEVKKILDAIGVPCYPKTSGSTGMHIYIPLGAKYTYAQSQLFGRLIANLVHHQIPGYTSVERQIKNRKGKMYLDFLQNRPNATLACPYSLRPKPGATVSMPLYWDEVKPGLTMRHFTIHNSINRLKKEGDIFKGVLGKGIDLEKTIKKAQNIFDFKV